MKKIPQRMCVACRQMFPKNQLLRVVRLDDATAMIDHTGKRNGRGAYLCANRSCLERALKTRALERALDIVLPEDCKNALKEEIADE